MNDATQEITSPTKYKIGKIGDNILTLTSPHGETIQLTNRSFLEVNFYFGDILSKGIETKISESDGKNVEILDLGSGTQSLAIREINKKYGKAIRTTSIDLYPKDSGGINAVQGDVRQLPFEANSFDIIFSVQVLNYIDHKDDKKIIDELNRVLKPGGLALLHWDSIGLLDLDKMQKTLPLQYAKSLGLIWKGKIFKSRNSSPQLFHAVIKPPVDKRILESIDQVDNSNI